MAVIVRVPNGVIVRVPDGGYSRNASYALKHCVYTCVSIIRSIPLLLVDY